jgi:hypothetical protein
MNWDKVFSNLEKMKGKKLKSISGTSDIKLADIDDETVTIEARTKGGKAKIVKRSVSELKELAALMKPNKPIHVDTELHGSGSSRNQPETLLANLPDVEWARVDGRKNIVWVVKDSHPIGTLRNNK